MNLQGSAPKPLKRALVRKLEPAFAALATRGAPSRLVEAIFVSSDVDEKEVVAKALASEAAKLQVRHVAPPGVSAYVRQRCGLRIHTSLRCRGHLYRHRAVQM